jgi:hypothetical protein
VLVLLEIAFDVAVRAVNTSVLNPRPPRVSSSAAVLRRKTVDTLYTIAAKRR